VGVESEASADGAGLVDGFQALGFGAAGRGVAFGAGLGVGWAVGLGVGCGVGGGGAVDTMTNEGLTAVNVTIRDPLPVPLATVNA
jgi:hypothetical protein